MQKYYWRRTHCKIKEVGEPHLGTSITEDIRMYQEQGEKLQHMDNIHQNLGATSDMAKISIFERKVMHKTFESGENANVDME